MAEVRDALHDYLRSSPDADKAALASALGDGDLAAARKAAKDEPASAEAAATVLARMIVDGSGEADLIDAAKALAQRAPRDESGTGVALLAGTVIWRAGAQPKLAEPYFRRARRSDPANPGVLAFYRELFSGSAGASQLMQVLVQARRGAKEDAELRFEIAAEMAKLAEEGLDSKDRAIEVWRSVLREDGQDARASQALERLYRESEKWSALVELLKEAADSVEDDQEKITKLLEIVELYRDRLNMDTMAVATLQRILEIDPSHEASLDALATTYASGGRWNDLLTVYGKRVTAAEESGDTASQVTLLRKVAEIWVDKLGNPQRALEPLARVMELAPGDREAREVLARIHEERRDWRALIALREEELGDLSGEEALARRVELAKLAEERLGDRREAIGAWNRVLEHHGDVDEALAALLRLYEREGRWAAAAEIMRRALAKQDDPGQAASMLSRLGSVYSDRLRSPEDALEVWKELVRLVPGHDKATRMLRDSYVGAARWDDLVELYREQGRLGDVVDVLQSAADRLADVEARVALYRRIADVCQAGLGQPERAQRALERTLAIQPDNVGVARELVPIYREQSNWARLMSTYEAILGTTDDDDERLELMEALQEVAEQKVGSATLTLQWAARAYALRPSDEGLRDGLERAAEAADGWDELTRIFEERIDADGVEDAEQLALLEKLASVARDRLFKPDDAQRYFRRIIELDPANAGAIESLEQIYSGTRRWDDLTEVYRKRLEVTSDADERLATLRGLAKIQRDQLGDLDKTVETLTEILALRSDDLEALHGLATIHRQKGQWQPLADALQQILDLTPPGTDQVPFLFELGELHARRLHDTDRAISEFLAVLDVSPTHADSVAQLEELRQTDPAASLPIMKGLLGYYRRTNSREKEAEALEVIVGAAETEEERVALYGDLARIYEKLPDRAADALRIRSELFVRQPGDWDNRQTLKKLGRQLGRVEDVVGAMNRVLAHIGERAEAAESEGRTLTREDVTLRRDLLLEVAAAYRDELGQPDRAEASYQEVLDQDETHQGAYQALESLLQKRGATKELVNLYRRRVDVVFNQREQKDLLSRIVDLSRNVLGDRATAVATAEEILDLIPDDIPTIKLLATMYDEGEDIGDKENLEELLGRWAELTSNDENRHGLQCRRAGLRMQYLGDAFGSVDLLGQILGENPDHQEARDLLEQLLDISEVQLSVCSLLQPIYERAGDHHGRIRVLRVRRAQAEQNGMLDEAVAHLLEAARIEEHELRTADTAFTDLREAYLMDPRRADTRAEVERVGLALRREADLVETWRKALASERVADKALRIDLTQRVAETLDHRMGDAEGARHAYGELLDLDPPDISIAQRAVEALCRLHSEAGDYIALVDAKAELLRFTDDRDEQVRIRLELATILERELHDRVRAALTYGEVLDMDAANLPALEALERLFLEEEEWERLCEVLEHRASVTGEPRQRAAVWRQIGDIRRNRLGARQPAIEAFQSVLDLKVGREDSVYALENLVVLNTELERWPDVEDGLRRMINLSDNDRDRTELLLRTAEVVGKRLSRGLDALELLKRVLDLAPTDARARSMVSAYLEDDDNRERAIRILTPLYEAEQNWPGLLALEDLQARNQPSGRRRLQALLKVANTHEERLADPDRAFAVLCAAMAEAADQPELAEILEKVERLGAQPERAADLLAAYESTVDHILDADLQRRVLGSMGQVALERLGQLDRARTAYERVADAAPDDVVAGGALEQIYQRQDDQEALANLLVRRAERADDPAVRDEALLRAANLCHTRLGQAQRAIELYERLGDEARARADVQAALEPLYEETGRFRELAGHLGKKLNGLRGQELVETHLRLGRLYGEQLQDPEEGIRHLSTALRLDPSGAVGAEELNKYLEDETMRARVAEILEPVFATIQDWPRLIQIQEIRLAEIQDPEQRTALLVKIAQIEEEQLEDLDRAFESYTRLFLEAPERSTVRRELHRLAGVLGRNERYAQLLTDFAEGDGASNDSDEVLSIVREAADLWAGTLRNHAASVPLYQRILAVGTEDPAVFRALENALTMAEMWPELLEAYWRESETALDDARRVDLLRRLAATATDVLDDSEEAVRAYQRVLEIDPDHAEARERMEGLLERSGRHAELMDALRDRLDRAQAPGARAATYQRMVAIQNGPLEDPESAVDTIEAWLGEQPADPDGVAALERVAEARREQRRRIIGILRPIYEAQGNIRRLIEVDEWQLASTHDPDGRHELYRGMAALHARGEGGPEGAFRVLCRALAEPGPAHALETLDGEVTRLAESLGLPGALAEAMVTAAGAEALASDEHRRRDLLVRAADLQLHGGEADKAAELLRQVLDMFPEEPRALALMDRSLARLGYNEELRGILERRVAVSLDDLERVELLRRLAILLEETLMQAEAAERAWRDLLDLEPNDAEALRRLSHVYEKSGSTDELVDVLRRQIEGSTDVAQRRDLRMQLASVLREAVKDRAAEVDVLRDLLVDVPSDDDAMAALTRALMAEERHAEAADAIQERAEQADSPERRAALVLEAARVYRSHLGDLASALERYESVLELVPGQDGALADLVELVRDEDSSAQVAAVALPQLEMAQRWADLATVHEARAELALDPEEKLRALRALARVRIEKLDDAPGSLAARIRCLDVVSPDGVGEALDAAADLAVQLSEAPRLVDELAARAASEDRDPAVRILFAHVASRLAEEVLGDGQKALDLLVGLLDANLADGGVCERIERLARAIGDAETAARALTESSRVAADPQDQAAALVRLGDLNVESQKFDDAVESYREALDMVSGLAPAIAGLEQVLAHTQAAPSRALLDVLENAYRTAGNRAGQAQVVKFRLQSADPAEQGRLLEQLADHLDEGGGSADEALETWGAVLAADSQSQQAQTRIVAIGKAQGLLSRAADLLVYGLSQARERGEPVTQLGLLTATLLLDDLGDGARAGAALEPVLEEDPEHPEALALMVKASRATGDPRAYHESLVKGAASQADPARAAELWREAAGVAELQLDDPALALEDLEQLIAVDESNDAGWAKLIALLSAAGDAERLSEALSRRAQITSDPEERRDLRYRLANLLVDRLERPDDAVAVYNDMVSDRPDDTAALSELEVLLRRLERWGDVRDVLERRLEVAEPDARVQVLGELARLAEDRLDDVSDAIERLQAILTEQPGHPEAEAGLERLLSAEERWEDLANLLEDRSQRLREAGDHEAHRTTMSRLAELLAGKLDDGDRAQGILNELLELDPGYVPAILALAAVYESRGDEGAVRLTLQRAADQQPQGEVGAELQLRLAALTDDTAQRREFLEAALQLSPGNARAARELLELSRKEENWGQVVYLLELAAGRETDEEKRRALVIERVDLMADAMNDPDGALRVLAGEYERVQDDTEINRRIADALFASSRYDEAAGMYNWLVEMGRQGKRNKRLAHDLTRLAIIALDVDAADARAKLREAYKIDTTNVETLMSLGLVHEQDGDWKDALKVYRTMLLQNADRTGLLRRGDLYANLARAHVALDERPKALAMLRRGIEEDAEHPELAQRLAELE